MKILIDGQTLETPEVNRGIGVYCINIINNMIKESFIHEWYITLSNRNKLNLLDPWVRRRIKPLIAKEFCPSTDYVRESVYTDRINQTINENKIDVFWMPNPMMVNVLFPNKMIHCPLIVTMYDLIPLIMPIEDWASEVKLEYQRRLKYILEYNVSLICISESTKKDFIKNIGSIRNIIVTRLGVDSKQFFKLRVKEGVNENPSIVYTGGFDYRKNIYGAVEAFALARKLYPSSDLATANFYIICNYDNENKIKFENRIKKLGLTKKVFLTGYVSNEELAEYYYNADVFFFPSLYEGFGLPVLEAMMSGAYIVSADNSSIPEVCGEHALLCNANDSVDMAKKLFQAFEKLKTETLKQKHERQLYAKQYDWEETAKETLEAIENINRVEDVLTKYKIAIVTPWPSQESGIANYVYKLVPYLSEYFNIDIFVDYGAPKSEEFEQIPYGKLYNINDLDIRHGYYDQVIYEIGNSTEYHTKIFEYFLKYPGIAEIHDFILQPFFYCSYYVKKKFKKFLQLLEMGYGEDGIKYYEGLRNGFTQIDNVKYPMSHSVYQCSKAVIFHNHWSKEQINTNKNNIYIIPLASLEQSCLSQKSNMILKEQFKKKYDITNEYIIGCFGFVNKNKRPEKVFQAVQQLIREGYPVKLVFFGRNNEAEINELIQKNKLENQIIITGYLNREEYEVALDITDIVVNLRYPSMGEASGTLCEAFKWGKPVIVSQLNQYVEFPDEVCWKVPVGKYEIPLLKHMLGYLLDHEDVRKALGSNAKAYADTVLSGEKISKMYYKLIQSMEGDK